VVLHHTTGGRQLVALACPGAEAAGVQPGMTLAHARALLHGRDPLILPWTPHRDAAALRSLAVWAQRFTPLVALDPPCGLLMDITGCQRLFGGEPTMVERLRHAMSRLGVQARAATAGTFGCAWAMARFGEVSETCIESGRERAALGPLPAEALRIDAPIVAGLHEVGIDRIGHLLDLPRDELAGRFGRDLLWRLDQALGSAPETVDPVRAPVPVSAERILDGPVCNQEALLMVVRQLTATVVHRLAMLERGALRLDLAVRRADAAGLHQSLMLSRPSRDEKHLWSLLRPRLESINMGHGIESVCLTAAVTGVLPHVQAEQWSGAAMAGGATPRALGEFLDTVIDRFGGQGIWRAELVESHLPERAFGLVPVARIDGTRDGAARSAAATPTIARPRPTVLLTRPEPMKVIALAPDGPPSWLHWRHLGGAVLTSVGPERIAREWWRDDAPDRRRNGTRDYYTVQDEFGRWLWIYRHLPTGEWFVHGQWG
jgi:protein ImuB